MNRTDRPERPWPVQNPTTRRGRKTREDLVAAAIEVFARDGYVNARVTEIADRAGVGHGTFYRYFESKDDVFTAAANEWSRAFMAELRRPTPPGLTPRQRIAIANDRYVDLYRRYAPLMLAIEQAATLHPTHAELRREVHRTYSEPIAKALARYQDEGLADPELDPAYAAPLLAAMAGYFSYVWLALGEPFDRDTALRNLDRLWGNALGLPPDDPPAGGAP